MLGGVGDRLSGDGWPVGSSDIAPGWPKGTLGGIGASFLETFRRVWGLWSAGGGPGLVPAGVPAQGAPWLEPGLPFCPDPGESSLLLEALVRSAPGWRPRPDGESEGTTGSSGGCSRRGEGRGAAGSSGGAGGCVEGGAHDPFRPADDEPLRATQDVSITLTPMPSFL